MTHNLDRRSFLARSAALAAAGTLAARAIAKDSQPLYKISLAQWSLNRQFFGGKLDALDFAKVAKGDYGIDAIEYVNQFYMKKKNDKAYLKELKKRADGEGVKSLLIMCDREGNLGEPTAKGRKKTVENHKMWVEWAKYLGCHSIRVNARSRGSYQEQLGRAADGLRMLTEFAGGMGINVLVENHGGLSSNGQWLAAVMKKVDMPRCGTLPDFGNFKLSKGKTYDRYKGVKELMPFAKAVSAKSHNFDGEGNEVDTDYRQMMKIVVAAGYNGYVGIEYEGRKTPAPKGIMLTKKLLEKVRDELA